MDDFPKCQACQQHFKLKGPSPYLLPCLHSVCETCVTSTAGGVISCSTCQREVSLTETHLQKDVVRQREIFHLTVHHRPSELLCTHEDDGNQAVCWCQECEEFLCEHCQTLHESFKATRRHAVQEIADFQPGSVDQEEYCSIHTTYPLDMWDRNCNILVCSRCRRGDHVGHDVEDNDLAVDASRMEIETQQKEVQRINEGHVSLLEMIAEQLRSADETHVSLIDKISHTFHSLKALLDQREKEILITLQQHTDQTKSDLDSKITIAQSNHLRCKVTLDYIKKALLYSSKYDLLKIKNRIGEITHSCIASEAPEKRVDIPLLTLHTDGLDKLKSILTSLGEIATLRDLSSQKKFSQDKATQKRVDYLTNLEEMENEYKKRLKQLEDDMSTCQSKVEELQTVVKDVTRQKEEAERDAKEAHEERKKSLDDRKIMMEENAKQKETIKSLERSVEDNKVTVKTLWELVLTPGCTHHLLKTDILDTSFILQCIHLKYDLDRVNLSYVHIDNNGVLLNKAGKGPQGNTSGRFQKYCGTTSTAPLPQTGHPQYMEVVCDVGIDKPLEWYNLVLVLCVCREEEMDVKHIIPFHQYCHRLEVFQCPDHNSVCTYVCKDDKVVHHLSDTLPNTVGSHTTLHYGMVYDSNRKVIIFMDVKGMKIIQVLDHVNCDKPLWPMFGVYAHSKARISMKLVVGNDINMTPEKKVLILKAL